MQKKVKRLFCLIGLAAMMLISCQRLPVSAAQREALPYILDTKRVCRIEIQTNAKQNTAGEQVVLYQVGLVDATSLSLSYVLTDAFKETKADLTVQESGKRAETIEKLRNYAAEQQLEPYATVVLKEDGSARLEVPQGAYLICQVITEEEKRGSGELENASQTVLQPTLVGIPYVNSSLDGWVYEIEVQLKAIQKNIATGDRQDPLLFGALAGCAVVLLALLVLARWRRKKM